MRKIVLFSFLFGVFIPLELLADSRNDVDRLVAIAIERDAILKEIEQKNAAEKVKEGEVFAFPPLQISYGYFLFPIETKVGPQRHKIGIQQAIPWPGLSTLVNHLPSVKAKRFAPQTLRRLQKIKYEVEQNAWVYWHHFRQIQLTNSHLILLDGLIQSTQALNEIGRVPKSSVSLVVFEKARIIDRLEREKSNLNIAEKALRKWIGEKEKVNIGAPEENGKLITSEEVHPDISALAREDAIDRALIEIKEKEDLPKFSMGVDYFEVGENEKGTGGQDALMIKVGVSIPIWSKPSKTEITSLQTRIIGRGFKKIELERKIKNKADISRLSLEDALRRVSYYKKTIIPLADIYRRDVTAEFETQRTKINDVIQAFDRVYRLQLALADAQSRYAKLRSALNFNLGIDPVKGKK